MKKLTKWFHKNSNSIQILTNIFTILGVVVAVFQISSGKEIIQAIFQSQEKSASYRLVAMREEIETNLRTINKIVKEKEGFIKTGQLIQVPLSINAYFSSPTVFKMGHLDKASNEKMNRNIAKIYVQWQEANNLIQSTLSLASSGLDPLSKKMVLINNNARIARIFEETQPMANEILKAIQAEPSPI
jgi:hypothetical protein